MIGFAMRDGDLQLRRFRPKDAEALEALLAESQASVSVGGRADERTPHHLDCDQARREYERLSSQSS